MSKEQNGGSVHYVKATLKHLVATDKSSEVSFAPDGSGVQCLKAGDTFLLPAVVWMQYDAENDQWVELTAEEEEEAVNILSESCTIEQVSGKEAGEQFSDDVGFVE